jgi:hypothetical protein
MRQADSPKRKGICRHKIFVAKTKKSVENITKEKDRSVTIHICGM